jgi:NAD(P)-dependent dehydrogenase (short-subunit alcohol dehydrogenase family)
MNTNGRVLITGCSRGIGLGLAMEFARHGWEVAATARRPESPALWNVARGLSNLHTLPLDVTDDASVAQAVERIGIEFEALDALVNNAGVFPGEGNETLDRLDLDWFGQAVETNVTGVARVTRACLPLLRRGERPRVANISSGAGSIGEKDDFSYYAYSVSKAGLNMLTRAMAAEFKRDGITVAAISPGWVKTEMGGPNAPLTVDESVRSLYQTINGLTLAQTGLFIGRDGSPDGYCW